jgi:hypothetical protein
MKNGSGSEKRKYRLTLKMVVVECTNKHDVTKNKFVDLFDDY